MANMIPEQQPEIAPKRMVWWAELLGSSLIFASVYLVLYLLYQAATAAAASYFGLGPVLYIDRISYDNGHLWWPHAVKRTYLIGAVFMGFLGVAFYVLYALLRKSFIFVRLFFLWASVIAFSMLAQRLIGVLVSGNFEFRKLGELGFELAVFGAYLYFEPQTFWMMATLGFILLGIVGFLIGKPFLQTAWSTEQIGDERSRFAFLKHQVMFPFVIGAGVVILLTFPDNIISNAMGMSCVALSLMFAIVRGMMLGPMAIPRQRNWERWPLVPVGILLSTLFIIWVVLRDGLHF